LAASLLLLAVEIAIALFVHDAWIRPYGGDVLAVILVYTLIRTFHAGPAGRALVLALGIAFAIEIGQYFQLVARLGLDGSALARTVIGTSFAWGDLVAYLLGALLVWSARLLFVARTEAAAATHGAGGAACAKPCDP
jgi:glycopeptide antibiotics resistance protein